MAAKKEISNKSGSPSTPKKVAVKKVKKPSPLKGKKLNKSELKKRTASRVRNKEQLRVTLSKVRMLEALAQTLGIVTSAADAAGMSKTGHYSWLKSDPDYRDAVDSIENSALDFAETSLLGQIRDKNTAATIFYLKTKGKHRGYVEASINFNLNQETKVSDIEKMNEKQLLDILKRGT